MRGGKGAGKNTAGLRDYVRGERGCSSFSMVDSDDSEDSSD